MKDLNAYWKESLSEKRVVITGGSTGIGREIALLLTSLGARCLICGRHQEQIDETIAASKEVATTGSCDGTVADIAKREDIDRLFETADQRLGGVDILINNAALGYGSVSEGDYEDWDYLVRANLTAYLACSHYAAKRMAAEGKGHIVNIGSMSADVREAGSSVYVATKTGIQGFSEALRKELNPKKIKVTLIEPGAVDTDMQAGSTSEKEEKVDNLEMLPAEDIAMAVGFCLAQHERCDIVGLQIRPHLQFI
ncbi:SDR family oxidoreductase [Sphingobacterium pedocola]|uniref:Oxidoreductase n=1 Tax=Sphingobacterium pedocola TaxID=2082722 RepID=A0ABR9TAY8_9SPHI|nr:SDR family oxidoreductase [Sphingobacterium pedocola]MBE8722510.1 oxidoreductase [Sphingobacterium pedocola]